MQTVVLKFGGSSVADNEKLNKVAERIIEFKNNRIVVVVSAQGNMTNNLIKEAEELARVPKDREMDMLLSVGEQITASKLSILLNKKGYEAISLTGWQAGIETNDIYQNAKIKQIHLGRIFKELKEDKIVIITGFQGYDDKSNITTLGRGGSDTTAVALAAALDAKCYIFSDVDGIYTADPKIVDTAKKLEKVSFEEMEEATNAGAKVLHNRCIKIGSQFDCDIIAAGTFSKQTGTKVCREIEKPFIKSIVKNSNIEFFKIEKQGRMGKKEILGVYERLLKNNIIVDEFKCDGKLEFNAHKSLENKIDRILESYEEYKVSKKPITKLTIIGYGITGDNKVTLKTTEILKQNKINILYIDLTQSKIEIVVDSIDDEIIRKLHKELIEKNAD